MIIQAGSSDRGKQFSERWAETVFVGYPDFEEGKRRYAAFKQGVARLGRDPDLVTVNTIAYPVAAATKAEAEDKMAVIEQRLSRGRRAVAAVRGAELRLRQEGHGRGVHATRSWRACRECRRCATG